MTLLEGSIAVSGTFAYVAQQAWILNATLRDNILFGKDYDEERFVSLLIFVQAWFLSQVWEKFNAEYTANKAFISFWSLSLSLL